MINRENFLNDDIFKQFFCGQEKSSTSFSESDRKKRLLINEIRNSKKTQLNMTCLKNVFNDYFTDPKKISSLLNNSFSILGKLSVSKKTLPKQKRYTLKTFSFRFVTEKECFDAIKSLGKKNLLVHLLFPHGLLKMQVLLLLFI